LSEVETAGLRSDAARNRETLLAAATRAFAASETEPSMRAIAREAGVGIATLYRHFPTRESLVDAVYRDQVERLTEGASHLLAELPPSEALRAWMDLFGDWLATKHGMLDTLLAMIEKGQIPHTHTRDELLAAITSILDAGATTGDIRTDVQAEEVSAGMMGMLGVSAHLKDRAQGARLLDLFMDGLRPTGPRASTSHS
jgi:AcrR family transcriptional regulator